MRKYKEILIFISLIAFVIIPSYASTTITDSSITTPQLTVTGATNFSNKTTFSGFNTTISSTHAVINHPEIPNGQLNFSSHISTLPQNTGTLMQRNSTGNGTLITNGHVQTAPQNTGTILDTNGTLTGTVSGATVIGTLNGVHTYAGKVSLNNINIANGQFASESTEILAINKTTQGSGINGTFMLFNGSSLQLIASNHNDACALVNTGFSKMGSFGGFIHVTSGNFTCQSQMLPTSNGQGLIGEGDCGALQAGCSLFSWPTATPGTGQMLNTNGMDNFIIQDIYLHGHDVGGTNACLEFQGDNERAYRVSANHCNGYGVLTRTLHAAALDNVYAEANDKGGFDIDIGTWSSSFNNLFAAVNKNTGGEQFLITNARNNTFSNPICQDSFNNMICFLLLGTNSAPSDYNNYIAPECLSVTSHAMQQCFFLDGAQHNNIIGLIAANVGSAASNSYDGIQLQSNAGRCSCYNNIADALISSTYVNKMRYGINEVDSKQGWNTYHNDQITGAKTLSERLQNTTSMDYGSILNNTKIFINQGGIYTNLPIGVINNTATINTMLNFTSDASAISGNFHGCLWYTNTVNNTSRLICNVDGKGTVLVKER